MAQGLGFRGTNGCVHSASEKFYLVFCDRSGYFLARESLGMTDSCHFWHANCSPLLSIICSVSGLSKLLGASASTELAPSYGDDQPFSSVSFASFLIAGFVCSVKRSLFFCAPIS